MHDRASQSATSVHFECFFGASHVGASCLASASAQSQVFSHVGILAVIFSDLSACVHAQLRPLSHESDSMFCV